MNRKKRESLWRSRQLEGVAVHHRGVLVEVAEAEARHRREVDAPEDLVEDQLRRRLLRAEQVIGAEVLVLVEALREAEGLGRDSCSRRCRRWRSRAPAGPRRASRCRATARTSSTSPGACSAPARSAASPSTASSTRRARSRVARAAVRSDAAQVRRLDRIRAAVAREMIRAQRVHHDEDQVGPLRERLGTAARSSARAA